MTKRTLAAMCALLVFMTVLVAVPLATSETAEAHTKTVKRCAYDPFTNVQQCWNENVAHTHSCGAGLTGTYPNCYPIPPDNDGDDGRNDDEREKEAERKRKEAEAKRKAEAERKRKAAEAEAERKRKEAEAEAERKRKAAEAEAERKRKEAEAEAERKRKAAEEAAKKECPSGEHRHGSGGCGPDHVPPCGVGKWDPGHGHASVDRPACTYSDASHATGPITYCGTQSHTHKTSHFHHGGDGCHPVADAHPTDPIRYTGANACANWEADVNKAIQSASSTYPLPPRATDCGTLGTLLRNTVGSVKGGIDALIDAVKEGREMKAESYERLGDTAIQANIEAQELWNKLPRDARTAGAVLVCAPAGYLGAVGGAAAGTAVGGPGAGTVVGGVVGGLALEAGCAIAVDRWANADFESLLSENRQKNDNDDGSGADDDSGDGTDSSDGTDDGDGTDDSGDGSEQGADPEPEADPKPTAAEIKQNDDELNEAARRYRDEEITLAEYQAAFQRWMRWRCEEMGQTKWCNR